MSSVNESIVREFFELNGFLVRQQRKFVAPNRRDDEAVDFFAFNPNAEPAAAPSPFVLNPADLQRVRRAAIVVKGWHTETFSPAVLEHSPDIYRFVQPKIFQRAIEAFGGDDAILKILVIPGLPRERELRDRCVNLLQEKGVDAALTFPVLLSDLIERIEVNRNYAKSDVLQLIRILKNYDLLKDPQLELFKPKRKRKQPNFRSGSKNS